MWHAKRKNAVLYKVVKVAFSMLLSRCTGFPRLSFMSFLNVLLFCSRSILSKFLSLQIIACTVYAIMLFNLASFPNLSRGPSFYLTQGCGASSGIGEATALHFATLGCSLSITARDTDALERVAAQCKSNGVEVLVKTADIRNTEEVSAIIKETAEHFGKIDIVVNCAGSARIGFVGEIPLEDFDDEININLRAVLHITQDVLPHLMKTKGNIVNVSSIGSMRPVPTVPLSGISKAGVDKLTKISALEYARYGIRVNSINPGPIETKMVFKEEMSPEMKTMVRRAMEASTVMGRLGTVEEAARAIAFLASDDASFITGHSLPVDGGSLLIGTLNTNDLVPAHKM